MVIDPHELKTIASMMPPLLLTIVGFEVGESMYTEQTCGREVSYFFTNLGLLSFFISGCIAIAHHDICVRAKQYYEAAAVSCMIVALVFTFNLSMNVEQVVTKWCCRPVVTNHVVF